MRKLIAIFSLLLCAGYSYAQPANDFCVNATAITIPASGSVCVTGTNTAALSDSSYILACEPGLIAQPDVWYTFITTGTNTTVTVSPSTPTPATSVALSTTTAPCDSSLYNDCDNAVGAGTATVTFVEPVGTQIWVQVWTNGTTGDFELCVNSTTPPPAPGKTCALAAQICDKSNFTLAGIPPGSDFTMPSCFTLTVNEPIYYTFTVGQTGTLEFTVLPNAPAEFDWALFDVTGGGCPGTEVACNYNYTAGLGLATGMSDAISCTFCPTATGVPAVCNEFCPAITVTAGNTYTLMIDNFSAGSIGFDFQWGGTFEMAPTAIFTASDTSQCDTLDVSFTNSSVAATTYLWDFGDGTTSTAASPPAHGYGPGTYIASLQVTSGAGCSDIETQTIQVFSSPEVIATGADESCAGFNDGVLEANVTGGTPGFTYSWNTSPTSTLDSVPDVGPGTYTVTVRDANFCTDTAMFTISAAIPIIGAVDSITQVSCNGFSDGEAFGSGSGGSGGLTFEWLTSPTVSGTSVTGLSAGTYDFVTTDGKGCTDTTSFTVTEPSALSASVPVSNPTSCFGGSDGSASASASGGTPGYTYAWSTTPVQTTATATGLTAGTYTVSVTDVNGCMTTASTFVTQPAFFIGGVTDTIDVSCNGGSDGILVASGFGGSPGYTYEWLTGPPVLNDTLSGVSAGTYDVVVTDVNGCTDTVSGAVGEPTALVASIPTSDSADCFGASDGSATAGGSGGTPGYTYAWSTTPVQTTITATGLAAGSYNVTVTDANGCNDISSVTIDQPTAVAASISGTNPTSCNGGSDGDASVTGAGGTPGYTYAWNTSPVQTTATATGLSSGVSYSVTVTDSKGCTGVTTASVSEPSAIVLTPGSVPATCGNSDGEASVSAAGGTPGYTYSWNTSPVQTTSTATGIPAGGYSVTVTDANGCTEVTTATISNLSAPTASIPTSANVTCFGGSNGSATGAGSGGTPGYTYAWSTSPVQTTATATGLAAGTYVLSVTDAVGCVGTQSVVIDQPSPVVAAIDSSQDVSCNGGSNGQGFASASGGTGSISYSWNTSPVQTTANATGLSAGTYEVYATDASGCSDTNTVTIFEPTVLVPSLDSTDNVDCNGGSDGIAYGSVIGGTPGYTYSWNSSPPQTTATATGLPAGGYILTITDANGCVTTVPASISEPTSLVLVPDSIDATCGNADGSAIVAVSGGTSGYSILWETGATTDTVSGLVASSYNVTVTDANGCVDSAQAIVNNIGAPTVAISSFNDVSCFGGANGDATASASVGTPPYSYAWSTTPVQTTITASGLAAGSYDITVTDNIGCIAVTSVLISEPSLLVGNIDTTIDASCNGFADGTVTGSASGGTSGYTYAWNTSPVQTTATATGLAAGAYELVVTDALGCTDTLNATVAEPTPLVGAVDTIFEVNCFGASDGSAAGIVSGGTPGYVITWLTTPTQYGDTVQGLSAGTYDVVFSDSNGCTDTVPFTVTQPTQVVADSTSFTPASCGNADGTATVNVSGGTPGYSYSWNSSPVQTTQTAIDLLAGTYVVTFTDINGCADTVSVEVTNLNAPVASIASTTDALCNGSADGTAIASVSGGTGPFTYAWSTTPPQTSDTANGLSAGSWTMTVTDVLGCTDEVTVTIGEPEALALDLSSTPITCFGDEDGTASAVASGGTAGYSYSWNSVPPQTGATATGLAEGSWMVSVTDVNGCTDTQSVVVAGIPMVVAGFSSDPAMPSNVPLSSSNVNFTNGSLDATTYVWDFGDGNTSTDENPSHAYANPGTYCVTLIAYNDNGCPDTVSACSFEVFPVELRVPNTFTPNGDGVNDNFVIENIQYFPENELQIFNRWGEKVYEKDAYLNEWDGTNFRSGKQLPDGAYFYVLYPKGGLEKQAGDIVIFR